MMLLVARIERENEKKPPSLFLEPVQPLGQRVALNHAAIGIPSSLSAAASMRAMKDAILSAGRS